MSCCREFGYVVLPTVQVRPVSYSRLSVYSLNLENTRLDKAVFGFQNVRTRNFERLLLGCTDTDFGYQILLSSIDFSVYFFLFRDRIQQDVYICESFETQHSSKNIVEMWFSSYGISAGCCNFISKLI